MPLSLSALKLSSVKRCRSFFISSGFNIFATFARKRIFAEFLTAFIIPSFCVCISCIVGLSVLLSSPKRSSVYSKSVIMPTRSNSIAPCSPFANRYRKYTCPAASTTSQRCALNGYQPQSRPYSSSIGIIKAVCSTATYVARRLINFVVSIK